MMFLLIVTLSSMLLAAIMSVIAWRIAAEERRRSEARIAALAAEIHAPQRAPARAVASQSAGAHRAEISLRSEPARVTSFPAPRPAPRWDADLPLRPVGRTPAARDLFATAPPARSGLQSGIVAAVGALVFAGALALMIVVGRGLPIAGSGGSRVNQTAPIARQGPATPAPAAAAPATVPLELIALGHERDSDRLTVHGVVRNPGSGAAVERLTAVVFAFNADGGFLASGRAIIDSSALGPGTESTFVVTVPGAGAVGRYRVSFRTDDRIVPHVDRRGPPKVPS